MGRNFFSAFARANFLSFGILVFSGFLSGCNEANTYTFLASSLSHAVGRAKSGTNSWVVNTGDGSGHMSFGPYTTALPEGSVKALYSLKTNSKAQPDRHVLTIDVYDANSNSVLASRDIYWKDFDANNEGNFSLIFPNNLKTKIEFRVYYRGTGYFEHASVIASALSSSFTFANYPAFGFNLNIGGYDQDVFGKTTMTREEANMRRDFALMASMGVKYVRLMIHNTSAGFNPNRTYCGDLQNGCAGATLDYSKMDMVAANLTRNGGILDIANEYGIKLIPMFHANAFYWDTWPWSWHWKRSYGASPAGFYRWVTDSKTWVNRIASQVDSSPKAARSILYWDLWNEFDTYGEENRPDIPDKKELIRALLRDVNISSARRGLSVIFPCLSGDVYTIAQAENRPLSYIDVHAYPDDVNPNLPCEIVDPETHERKPINDLMTGDKVDLLKKGYPGIKYLLGEFAVNLLKRDRQSYFTEDEQANMDLETYLGKNSAQSGGAMAALRWDLWDGDGVNKWGLGPNRDSIPRNIYGRYVDLSYNNMIESGGDFERVDSEKYWRKMGPGASVVVKMSTTRSDTATGTKHLRLYQRSSSDWICGPKMVPAGKKTIFVSGYVRHDSSSTRIMKVGILNNGAVEQIKSAPGFAGNSFKPLMGLFPSGIKFNIDGIAFPQVCFSTDGTYNNLDLDAVSVNGF